MARSSSLACLRPLLVVWGLDSAASIIRNVDQQDISTEQHKEPLTVATSNTILVFAGAEKATMFCVAGSGGNSAGRATTEKRHCSMRSCLWLSDLSFSSGKG